MLPVWVGRPPVRPPLREQTRPSTHRIFRPHTTVLEEGNGPQARARHLSLWGNDRVSMFKDVGLWKGFLCTPFEAHIQLHDS